MATGTLTGLNIRAPFVAGRSVQLPFIYAEGQPSGFPSLRAKQEGGSFITPHHQNSDRYVKGSRMENDSLIEEEQGSVISFASYSSKRPVPVPPAPRVVHIMKRNAPTKGGRMTKERPFKNRISDLRDTHSKRLPDNLQRPPFMKKKDPRIESPFEPDSFSFKKNPHETIVTKLYDELLNIQQQEKVKADAERSEARKRRSLSPTGDKIGRQTILSMNQSVASCQLQEPVTNYGSPAEMIALASAATKALGIRKSESMSRDGIVKEINMMDKVNISQDKHQEEGSGETKLGEAEPALEVELSTEAVGELKAEKLERGEEIESDEREVMAREDGQQYQHYPLRETSHLPTGN